MRREITRGEQNLILLEAMLPRNEQLFIWCYSMEGRMIATSCPATVQESLEQAFRGMGGLDKTLRYATGKDGDRPTVIGSSIGAQWGIVSETEREERLIFVIGPVFYTQPDAKKLGRSLYGSYALQGNTTWIDRFLGALPQIQILSHSAFYRYVIMVHNTLTGEQLGLEALTRKDEDAVQQEGTAVGVRNRLNVYQAERALLAMVREGNINYQAALRNSADLSPGVPVEGSDPLRQMKLSIIVFTTLVSRAAMEGGLSPEVAYSLGDSYIQTAESSRDSGELQSLSYAMYHDFIYRVHQARANPDYSHAIQKCCDYIELNLDKKLQAADLAALVGYTEYYFTEKFKKETGLSVSNYIRNARITRSRMMLESTQLSVAEIAERLGFNTPNYFIQCFRDVVGCTPAQYRKKHQTQEGVFDKQLGI